MFQRIDVIIYRMLVDGRAMACKAADKGSPYVVPFVAIGLMQAFRLGMMRMISWKLTCG